MGFPSVHGPIRAIDTWSLPIPTFRGFAALLINAAVVVDEAALEHRVRFVWACAILTSFPVIFTWPVSLVKFLSHTFQKMLRILGFQREIQQDSYATHWQRRYGGDIPESSLFSWAQARGAREDEEEDTALPIYALVLSWLALLVGFRAIFLTE